MKMIERICPVCNLLHEKSQDHHNFSLKRGTPFYCSQKCAGIGRRHNKTSEQLKAEKAEYDRKYREKNLEAIKQKKKEYFQKDYKANPEKYKLERQRRMTSHVEYCRNPQYKVKKKQYDHRYRLEVRYGEYWEAASVLVALDNELDSKQIKIDNGIINKSLKRKRQWKTLMQNH